jgi:hypothetical protein
VAAPAGDLNADFSDDGLEKVAAPRGSGKPGAYDLSGCGDVVAFAMTIALTRDGQACAVSP